MAQRDVAVFVGSLRKESLNRKIAKALIELAHASLKLEIVEIGDLPLYNADLDTSAPVPWTRLRERIKKADAVLFVTPEYNRSVPGVLKNAIDVASRPYGKSSFFNKPVGIVANSPGPLGGIAAAMHLKQFLPGITGPILQHPENYLNNVGDAFNPGGDLTKEALEKVMKHYIEAFAAFVAQHHK